MTRRPILLARLAALLFACLLGACAAGERLVTSRGEYWLYRETRVAEHELARLGAANRYLVRYPDGRYRRELAGWFAEADARYVRRAHDHPSLLRAYLEALPDGPRTPAVRARLEELEIHRGYQVRRSAREQRELTRVTGELEQAVRSRRAFVQRVTELVTRLAEPRSFGRAPRELEPVVRRELEDEHGELTCSKERCTKLFLSSYLVPDGPRFTARDVSLELSLELQRGLVERAELAGPELFSRLGEAVERRKLDGERLGARVDAIARAAQVVENALEWQMPAAECARQAVAPAVVVRDCRGVRVEVRAGLDAPPRDAIVITRSRMPPMP